MKTRLMLLISLLLAGRMAAEDLAYTVLAPAGTLPAGRTVQVKIAAMNPGARETPFALAGTLAGSLAVDGREWPVKLTTFGATPVAVAPGGFAVRRFDLELPADLAGRAVLEVKRDDGPPLYAVIQVAVQRPEKAGAPPMPPVEELAASAPATSALARNFAGRFLPNQPIYFIYGSSEQAAKFQFSFDYRLASMVFGSASSARAVSLRGGYTQRSVWNLNDQSSPFYDTSYMPELVLSTEAPMPLDRTQAFTWLGWRAGVQHESNGKDGTDSRSLNTFYVRPRFVLGTLGDWVLVMLPEVQLYLGDLKDNPDLKDYRGYGKLRFYLGRNDGPTLMFTGWAGKDFNHGTFQLDLAVPTRVRWIDLESYFYVQYFDGYGESLRGYNQRSDALRAGISLVR